MRRHAIATASVLLASLGAAMGMRAFPAPAFAQEGRDDLAARLAAAALDRVGKPVRYDGRYRAIPYPGGDVPQNVGVCTDVIVRAYRAVGIDLQKEVHEDMTEDFGAYPGRWGLDRPDPNIDHRRVANLETFFGRRGRSLPVSDRGEDYRPGDLVTWTLPGGNLHIGIVVDRRARDGARPLVVHHLNRGPRMEDILFAYPIRGHYRYPAPDR